MSNITETAQWEATVYQIDTSDLVLGGANGASNAAAQDLANRTAWLKVQVDALNDLVTNLPSGTLNHTTLINRDAADSHPISAITGLQSALDGKITLAQAAAAAPIQVLSAGANVSITPISGVTGGYSIAATSSGGTGTSDHAALSNRSLADQHPIGAISGLQSALDGKAGTGHTHSATAITSGTLDRERLPTASTAAAGIVQLNDTLTSTSTTQAATASTVKALQDGKAATNHTHPASSIISGTLDPARLPTATNVSIGAMKLINSLLQWDIEGVTDATVTAAKIHELNRAVTAIELPTWNYAQAYQSGITLWRGWLRIPSSTKDLVIQWIRAGVPTGTALVWPLTFSTIYGAVIAENNMIAGNDVAVGLSDITPYSATVRAIVASTGVAYPAAFTPFIVGFGDIS